VKYEPLVLIGEAYVQTKDCAKAAVVLEKAIVLRRPDTRLLNILAVSLYHTGNTARAQELLERSLSQDPEQPDVEELFEKLKSGEPGQ
jgi:Flp pilus assembly protein TadD